MCGDAVWRNFGWLHILSHSVTHYAGSCGKQVGVNGKFPLLQHVWERTRIPTWCVTPLWCHQWFTCRPSGILGGWYKRSDVVSCLIASAYISEIVKIINFCTSCIEQLHRMIRKALLTGNRQTVNTMITGVRYCFFLDYTGCSRREGRFSWRYMHHAI